MLELVDEKDVKIRANKRIENEKIFEYHTEIGKSLRGIISKLELRDVNRQLELLSWK